HRGTRGGAAGQCRRAQTRRHHGGPRTPHRNRAGPDGIAVQGDGTFGAGDRATAGVRALTASVQSHTLARLAGIRHAFFTRAGGVSGGVYASLNAGVGSNDAPRNVAENRARMAGTMGVPPERFLTCYQIHSPAAVVAVEPWSAE